MAQEALQRERIYELIIGDWQTREGLKINNLQLTFDVSKSSNNAEQTNSAAIEVYNLSKESLKILETDFPVAVLSVGYKDLGEPVKLISGEVIRVSTRRSGPDRVTQILLGSGYVELNHTYVSGLVPAGKRVEDVIEEIRRQMPGVARGVYTGTNLSNPVIYGYPLTGTPKEMLNELARANRFEWRIDHNALYVNDLRGTTTKDLTVAPVISPSTGLIEIPYFTSGDPTMSKKDEEKSNKLQFKALLNPHIVPGTIVRLISEEFDGYYKVEAARFYGDWRGNDWYVDVVCSVPE